MAHSRKGWREENAPWRKEAKESKHTHKQNICDSTSCQKWMPKFDIHKLCISCRPDKCNGSDITCHECSIWPKAQRDALRWTIVNKEKISKRGHRKSTSSHSSDKSNKSATADIPPTKESNLHQMNASQTATISKPNTDKNLVRPGPEDHSVGAEVPNPGPITSAVMNSAPEDILTNPLLSLNPNLSEDEMAMALQSQELQTATSKEDEVPISNRLTPSLREEVIRYQAT